MAITAHAVIGPNKEIVGDIVVVETGAVIEVPANSIAVYITEQVPLYRQLEIVTGWEMLWNGVRDRNLLDEGNPFSGLVLYTAVDIDSTTEHNRRTSSDIGFYNSTDVGLGISPQVTGTNEGTNMLEVAFNKLFAAVQEQVFKVS